MSANYAAPGQPAEDPGRTLGIVGFILSFLAALVGMIISIVAYRKSKAAGFKNGLALAGIIIGAVITVGYILGGIGFGLAIAKVAQECQQLGPGSHQVGGTTVNCG